MVFVTGSRNMFEPKQKAQQSKVSCGFHEEIHDLQGVMLQEWRQGHSLRLALHGHSRPALAG
jgi:hypothetical protein